MAVVKDEMIKATRIDSSKGAMKQKIKEPRWGAAWPPHFGKLIESTSKYITKPAGEF